LGCLDEGEHCVTPPYLPIIHRQYLMHVPLQMKSDLMGVLQGETSRLPGNHGSWGPPLLYDADYVPRLPDAILPDTIMLHKGDCTFSSTSSSRYVHTRRESTFHCHVISFQKLDWLKAM